MEVKFKSFTGLIVLFCLLIFAGCNSTLSETSAINTLSDTRFNGEFRWSDNDMLFSYKFNGSNIVENSSSFSLDTGEEFSFSFNEEFEVVNGKYRCRPLFDNESIGEWSDWLDYNFSDDNNILVLQLPPPEGPAEVLEMPPPVFSPIYIEYTKL